MLKHETLISAIEVAAELRGFSLNGQERLVVRTRVDTALAAKERHRQRLEAPPYQWRKPDRPRR
ncbi:TPA: hypothetical protein ACJ2TD_001826 [Klebsiella pneumoniae]